MSAVGVTHVMEFSHFADRIVFSGAENHLFALMHGQVGAGHDVSLVMLVGRPGPALAQKSDELREAGIAVDRLEPARAEGVYRRRISRAATLPHLVRLLGRRRDQVIHTHLTLASQVGRLAAASAGCRYVVDSIHNNEPFFDQVRWKIRLRALDRVTRRYIAASDAIKQQLVSSVGLAEDRVDVVRYGLPPPSQVQPRDVIRKQLDLPNDAVVVGCVGRLTKQKNLEFFIDIMDRLPDVIGVLVGEGEDRARLEAVARRKSGDVRFLGYQPDGAATIGALDAVLLPSLWEGLGLVMIEAMHRKVPVIGSDRGAIPEVLGHGRFGLVLGLNSFDDWVQGIETLVAGGPDVGQMTHAAHQWSLSEFSVEKMVTATASVYSAATAGAA